MNFDRSYFFVENIHNLLTINSRINGINVIILYCNFLVVVLDALSKIEPKPSKKNEYVK